MFPFGSYSVMNEDLEPWIWRHVLWIIAQKDIWVILVFLDQSHMCEYGYYRDIHNEYGWYRYILDRQENKICEQKGIKKVVGNVFTF